MRRHILTLAALLALPLAAEEAKPEAPKPATATVSKAPFRVDLSLEGSFEAAQSTEVSYRPEAWGDLKILKGLAHGTPVKSGDALVTPDTRAIDEAIGDLERELAQGQVALGKADLELPLLEKAAPLELAAAERAKGIADEELEHFTRTGRAQEEAMIQVERDYGRFQLESEEEELRQLEKMYKADDLVEETEEIVLKRQRLMVRLFRIITPIRDAIAQRALDVGIPHKAQDLAEAATLAGLNLERLRAFQPKDLMLKRTELDKLRTNQQKGAERLGKLKADREGMTLKAPAAGILYHGRCDKGKWSGEDAVTPSVQRGGALPLQQVLFTVLQARPLVVRAIVPEASLHDLKPGMKGRGIPAGWPDLRIPATVLTVSPYPEGGAFTARLAVELPVEAGPVAAGMSCTLRFSPYARTDAIAVASKAVFDDEMDEDRHYVWVQKDGRSLRRDVKTGRKSADRTEILEGLADGEEILLEKPAEPAGK